MNDPAEMKRGPNVKSRGRRRVRWALAALCAVIFLATSVSAGSRYVFCSMMGELVDEPCCDIHVHARSDGSPEVAARSDCCSERVLDPASPSVTGNPTQVPTRSTFAAKDAPCFAPCHAPQTMTTALRFDAPSTGPPRPSDIPRRLCVFLI